MDFTDYFAFGLRDGRCVASGWLMAGKGGDKRNAGMISEWVKSGLHVVTLHKDDAEAERLLNQMYDDAEAAAKMARPAKS